MSQVNLNPKKELSTMDKVENYLLEHSIICLVICFIILFILLTVLFYHLVGVSATDSGVYYYHLKDVI